MNMVRQTRLWVVNGPTFIKKELRSVGVMTHICCTSSPAHNPISSLGRLCIVQSGREAQALQGCLWGQLAELVFGIIR